MTSKDDALFVPWYCADRHMDLPPENWNSHEGGQDISAGKATGRLLHEVYQASASLPIGKFEKHIFLPIQDYLPFDSAWLGRSTITDRGPVMHESYTFGLPANYVSDWQLVRDEDPLAPRVTAAPGAAVALQITDAGISQGFRDFGGKFGLAQLMCAIHLDPVLNTCTHLSLYRERLLPGFSSRDKELLEALVPNIAAAITMNRVRHIHLLRAESSSQKFSVAACNRRGIIQYAEGNFGEFVLMEWPEWKGSLIPSALLEVADSEAAPRTYVGKSVVADIEWEDNNLLIVKIRTRALSDSLSPRELAIARMFGEGKTYKEVAKYLGISPATVRHHLRQAYIKLKVQNKGEIAWLLK